MMQRSKTVILMVVMTLSVLVLTRVITISPGLVNVVASCYTYPLLIIQHKITEPIRQIVARWQTIEELRALVDYYRRESDKLRAENIELAAEKIYWQHVQELINFTHRYKTERKIGAQVILKQFSDEGHAFLLDVGSNRGVEMDMIAVYNNCLIGRVSEVYPWYCKVMLVTDHLSKVPVVCVSTDAHGIHEGLNNLTETGLSFVSHLQSLIPGDLVISSGDGLIYPKGFAVGKIRGFSLNDLGINYIVAIDPLLNLREINYCYLVAKGAEYIKD